MRTNKTLEKILAGGKTYGCGLSFPCPQLVELAGLAGFDYVFLDGEHGGFTLKDIEEACRTADLAGLTPIARVPNLHEYTILQFLDRGIMGIQGPHIMNVEDAQALVRACYFAPIGERSFGGSRGTDYGTAKDRAADMARRNEQMIVVAQLEDIRALELLPEILTVSHIKFFRFGPNDLAQSMGLYGQPSHPNVLQAIEKASSQIRSAGKMVDTDVMIRMETTPWFLETSRRFLQQAKGS